MCEYMLMRPRAHAATLLFSSCEWLLWRRLQCNPIQYVIRAQVVRTPDSNAAFVVVFALTHTETDTLATVVSTEQYNYHLMKSCSSTNAQQHQWAVVVLYFVSFRFFGRQQYVRNFAIINWYKMMRRQQWWQKTDKLWAKHSIHSQKFCVPHVFVVFFSFSFFNHFDVYKTQKFIAHFIESSRHCSGLAVKKEKQ